MNNEKMLFDFLNYLNDIGAIEYNEPFQQKTYVSNFKKSKFHTTPKEPEAVHSNEREREVCEHIFYIEHIVNTGQVIKQCVKCWQII